MKFKKILCLLFAVLMLFSGCSESEDAITSEENEFSAVASDELYVPPSTEKNNSSKKPKGELNLVEIEDLNPSDRKNSKEDSFSAEVILLDGSDGIYDYVLNNNTMKFHYEECESVNKILPKNKAFLDGTRENAIAMGYVPCKNCNP
jgi:PBP1b-binding outer membrane lipoprotein LpoB